MPSSRASRASAAIGRNQAKTKAKRKGRLERAADKYLRKAGYDEKGRPTR